MPPRVTSWLARPSLLRTLFSHLRLAARLVREPRVGRLVKALPVLAAVYVISPLDLIPDVIPVLGQLDDMGLLLMAIEAFLKVCPEDAVAFHRAAIAEGRTYSPMGEADRVIDAEWRRED
jgi:uncharacterized membrane protein YkvA (DUF1232 family)